MNAHDSAPVPPPPAGPPPGGSFGPPPQDFGPPSPATPPTPPPRPGQAPAEGGPRRGGRPAVLLAAVLALAVLIAGGTWYLLADRGQDGDSPRAEPSGEGQLPGAAQQKPQEKAPADPTAATLVHALVPEFPRIPGGVTKQTTWKAEGSWLTERVYAKTSVREITGYAAATGEKLWSLPLKGASCGGSPQVGKGGVAAVVVQDEPLDDRGYPAPCTEVLAFDLDTGKRVWSKSFTAEYQSRKTPFDQVVISKDTVAAGGIHGGAGFDLADGSLRWEPEAGECGDRGYGGGPRLVAVRVCGPFGKRKFEAHLIDPDTGRNAWRYRLPAGATAPKVLSTDPVVLGVDTGTTSLTGIDDVFSLDARGRLRYRITLEDDRFQHSCRGAEIAQSCRSLAVGNDRLYVPTRSRAHGKGYWNEIVSFSLADGKPTRDRFEAGDGNTLLPLRMDGPRLLAYKSGTDVSVVSVDPRKGTQETLLTSPDGPIGLTPEYADLRFTHGRLYVGSPLLGDPAGGSVKQHLAYGFGPEA
ncbi:outer membrane protein assembly factor BamB family protein [Streptomyces physcomitrii]|uniref:PQQ-binding-like beta-propeller repeat protein n=1 Tax=Streptomyces physcomitrii TaxID=2724184 RepID=A0ABX1H263_9ACTN|nr:PQQ-binding-like beta-propeller repeat protein [Streptomyces physcomitrii]NKI42418.1 PQQ-binding-like beta-propeller repeat protein [Streptomyces physcomitrii]